MNKAKFFKSVRDSLFNGTMTQKQVEGIELIYDSATEKGWLKSWIAYALATAYHETAKTMQPISEYGNNGYFENNYGCMGKNPTRAKLMGNTNLGDGIKYRGRGYVQLTWKNNYKQAGDYLGVDLVNNPDLALDKEVATKILIWGMLKGKFTGKKLSDYLPVNHGGYAQFMLARNIINGRDKAALIAGYALKFQEAMAVI